MYTKRLQPQKISNEYHFSLCDLDFDVVIHVFINTRCTVESAVFQACDLVYQTISGEYNSGDSLPSFLLETDS